jgi:putative ABC transport system permease protein
LKQRLETDPRLTLEVKRENRYYAEQSEIMSKFLNILGLSLTVIFSLGAMLGAMITMYASISSRQREVGTLRALGFPRRSILASFLLESAIISIIGGVAGCAASLALSLVRFSMLNMKTWSEVVFTFHPTPRTLGGAFVAAVVMGVLGGFLPALRAARLSPIEAMRGE